MLKFLLVHYKLMRRKFLPTASFCKICGRDVRDFIVPDIIWEMIDPHIKRGHTLCYNCFTNTCRKIGLPVVWELRKPKEEK